MASDNRHENVEGGIQDKVVKVRRCAAVVKGGRRFSFTALVVVGDGEGKVAWGYGKANEVPPAVSKAIQDGTRKLQAVCLEEDPSSPGVRTIPHVVEGRFGASRVRLVPAGPGTGVIAGAAVRAVCEAAGITDILTKSYGSPNATNLVKATIEALNQLRSKTQIENLRGVKL
ncbi:MAG: 30S ribosomal protein S5 [Thermoguttaceae bacterium]|jgi:small subunit ribosomal protein S5|nr:30S ribosomal protein S5 [Thermoguttaceae bacterium]